MESLGRFRGLPYFNYSTIVERMKFGKERDDYGLDFSPITNVVSGKTTPTKSGQTTPFHLFMAQRVETRSQQRCTLNRLDLSVLWVKL